MSIRMTKSGEKIAEILFESHPAFVPLADLCAKVELAPSSVTREITMLRMTGWLIVTPVRTSAWDDVNVQVQVPQGATGYAFVGFRDEARAPKPAAVVHAVTD